MEQSKLTNSLDLSLWLSDEIVEIELPLEALVFTLIETPLHPSLGEEFRFVDDE